MAIIIGKFTSGCPCKRLIDEGYIERIFHWRAVYLQDWITDPNFPLVWRLRAEKAGSGPHGDLNAHIIDLAQYLLGNITQVVGMQRNLYQTTATSFRRRCWIRGSYSV